MLSWERVPCLTQLCSDPKIQLKPEFVFKVIGTRTHLTPPKAVHNQWTPKWSYRIEQILDMIDKLPNRFNIITEQSIAIYVLDDYSVHLMPEVRQALFKIGYVLVIIGGSIAGDIQINDPNFHRDLKNILSRFRDEIDARAARKRSNENSLSFAKRDNVYAFASMRNTWHWH